MKKTLTINSHNGGKVNIIVEDRKTNFCSYDEALA
jgi:hypothetical protein